jgi:hypothetical protein
MAPDRPEHTKAGEVSVNVPDSAITSIDQVLDALGLPEAGPVVYRLLPDNVLDALGIESPDEITDDMLRQLDEQFGINYPPER